MSATSLPLMWRGAIVIAMSGSICRCPRLYVRVRADSRAQTFGVALPVADEERPWHATNQAALVRNARRAQRRIKQRRTNCAEFCVQLRFPPRRELGQRRVLGDRWRGNGSDSREGQERGGREGEQAALCHRAIDRESKGAPAPLWSGVLGVEL